MRHLLLALTLTTASAAQSFTLEQALSAPFSYDLTASPKGDRLLWTANIRGHRNLFLAEPSPTGYTAHPLTHYDTDDGIDLGDLTFTPDGNSAIFARGGDFEFPAKPPANPALLPGGVIEEIFQVPADASAPPRRLAEGRLPVVSPDGSQIAFLAKGQVYTLALKDPAAKPVQLFHARGNLGALLWAPDGHALAFTSARGDHGFIGLYTPATNTLLYLDPSTDVDQSPAWSPDSKHLVFLRLARETPAGGFKPHRTAPPWSIRLADPVSGQSQELFRAKEGPGSAFHPLAAGPQLTWTAQNHILFPWEQDGWEHLYSITLSGGSGPTTGGTPALLTPGPFEIEHLAVNPTNTTIAFSSNQATADPQDIDRRHIWQLPADDPKATPKPLTPGTGIEVFPTFTSSGQLAVLRSDPRIPIRPAILTASGELKDLAPQLVPPDFPAAKLVTPTQVILSAADGMRIHAQLFTPTTPSAKPRQALIFFHGGSRREMLLGWHYMDYYSNAYAMNQYLASLGYLVLSVNYRSGIGYGLNFREAINYGAGGASEFNDVLGAGLYLRSRPDVDPAHIGVWGGSYGGYLTALALARASDLFAAGVDFHGVHDWNIGIATFDPSYAPASDAQRLAFESSPLSSVKTWRSPVLLIQGDDDRNVDFSQTVRLAAALREQGTYFEEHVFPDEIHGFLLWRSWIEAYHLTADFFHRKL